MGQDGSPPYRRLRPGPLLSWRGLQVGIDFAPPVPALRPTSMRGFSSQPHPRMAALLHRFLTAHWRGFQAPLDLQCSPYCMTRDLSFVLGALPDLPQVLLFAGDCGRQVADRFGCYKLPCLAGGVGCILDMLVSVPTVCPFCAQSAVDAVAAGAGHSNLRRSSGAALRSWRSGCRPASTSSR
jgi:hypothetical protein